jgi:PHD/YefM family antitoxin component YafN of YafNO toxin-antitoxin module
MNFMSDIPSIEIENIRALSDFQRNAKQHIKRLKKTGKPEVLTVNGRAEIVVQDAASYQKLLADLEHAQAVSQVRVGLEQAKRGEGRPMRQAVEEIAARHGIKLRK